MTLVKTNTALLNSFPMFFDDIFNRDFFGGRNSSFSPANNHTVPAVNIRETQENFEVEVAAPGMSKSDFKIELDGNVLTISSEKTEEARNTQARYSVREFGYHAFRRSFTLKKDVVDLEGIQAKYENGLLQLLIPKKEEVKQKPARLIEIA
jgi:HSP20 family protein